MCDLVLSEEDRAAHLDLTPDGGKKAGGVDDGNLVNGFWIMGSGKLRGLL